MNTIQQFDDAGARHVAATYATADIVKQRQSVRAALNLQPGETVVDIGSGPGYLAYEMAEEVRRSGSVHGVDPSHSMIAIARDQERFLHVRSRTGSANAASDLGRGDIAPVTFTTGVANALPFDDGHFDVAVATQVYEYVEDVPGALREAQRVLRPGGRLLILDTDWDSIVWSSSDPARMRRVLAAWDSHLVDPYLPRRIPQCLEEAQFDLTYYAAVPLLNVGYNPNTYSAWLIQRISSYLARHRSFTHDELRAWNDDLVQLGPHYFFSLNRYLFVAVK